MFRIHTNRLMLFFIAAMMLTACRKDVQPTPDGEELTAESLSVESNGRKQDQGTVYTLSNQADGNKVLEFRRARNGEIELVNSYSTGGKGTGAGLGNQGAIAIADNDGHKDFLLAVNAASNSISSFKMSRNGLQLVSVVHSQGVQPISITEHDGLVYVLNAGGNGNIAGFRLAKNGKLYSIPWSKRPLSSSNAGGAQVSFVNEGKVLVITEKNNNKIISYAINHYGLPGQFHSLTSANATPFGFAVGRSGKIFVSEAAGGASEASTVSSYQVYYNGEIRLITGPVAAGQTAACWVVITDDNKYVYATNTGSNTVTSFSAGYFGKLTVKTAAAGATGMGPIDASLSDGSKFLYVLNAASNSINVFAVGYDGSLTAVETETGLPVGATGLAAE